MVLFMTISFTTFHYNQTLTLGKNITLHNQLQRQFLQQK
jgi:hypothetical protein